MTLRCEKCDVTMVQAGLRRLFSPIKVASSEFVSAKVTNFIAHGHLKNVDQSNKGGADNLDNKKFKEHAQSPRGGFMPSFPITFGRYGV